MRAPYPPAELLALFVFFLAGLEGASAQTTLQGPNDCTTAGAYTLCQNLWGAGESYYLRTKEDRQSAVRRCRVMIEKTRVLVRKPRP